GQAGGGAVPLRAVEEQAVLRRLAQDLRLRRRRVGPAARAAAAVHHVTLSGLCRGTPRHPCCVPACRGRSAPGTQPDTAPTHPNPGLTPLPRVGVPRCLSGWGGANDARRQNSSPPLRGGFQAAAERRTLLWRGLRTPPRPPTAGLLFGTFRGQKRR